MLTVTAQPHPNEYCDTLFSIRANTHLSSMRLATALCHATLTGLVAILRNTTSNEAHESTVFVIARKCGTRDNKKVYVAMAHENVLGRVGKEGHASPKNIPALAATFNDNPALGER
ncbi:MAG TPA: hypothetical protein VE907_03945 [Gammaproteobacteria bacterium]|nr:hypothetical protein [Gammaproteobacteria bacterium]